MKEIVVMVEAIPSKVFLRILKQIVSDVPRFFVNIPNSLDNYQAIVRDGSGTRYRVFISIAPFTMGGEHGNGA